MATTTDFIVIGGGMAGSSAAYELAAFGRVHLLERENQPGYHSTGRSAATLIDTYGNPVVNGLTVASRTFIESPPAVFGDDPVFERRGMLLIAREDQLPSLDREMAAAPGKFARLTGAEAVARIPVLDPDYVAAAVHDSTAIDLDVHAIQQGYLRGARERGAETLMGAEVRRLERADGLWQVTTDSDTYTAPVVVNAAGAWADAIAGLAGLAPLGVVPKRRTAINIDPPDGVSVASWPMAVDVDEQFYFKPDAGRLLVSPADETPSPGTRHRDRGRPVRAGDDNGGAPREPPMGGVAVLRCRQDAGRRRRLGCGRILLASRPGRLRHHDRAGHGLGDRRRNNRRGFAARLGQDRRYHR
jgi:D-arginine dehydrogenase